MKFSDELREHPELSCRVLADLIMNARADHPSLHLLLKDFETKRAGLSPTAISRYIPGILSRLLPPQHAHLVEIMNAGRKNPRHSTRKKRHVDVAIITVILEELLAAKVAFNVPLDKVEDRLIDGYRYWDTNIDCSGGVASLVDHTHPAFAQLRFDPVVVERPADH